MICLHHVGGRSGGMPLPATGIFGPELVTVFYDADADAIHSIPPADTQGSQYVLPFALGGTGQRDRPFYITLNRFGSSLLPPLQSGELYANLEGVDFDCHHSFAVIEERRVDVLPFDDLWSNQPEMQGIPRPDVLSLDTQGSEYEILTGAKNALSHDVLAVICEVEFTPLYRGQKLFQDVMGLLQPYHLSFARFFGGGSLMGYQSPLGVRGFNRQIFSNALFLRTPETLGGDALRLRKLAFLSLLTGHLDVAWKALSLSAETGAPMISPMADRFLSDVVSALSSMPQLYPPHYHTLITVDKLDAFDSCRHPTEWWDVFDARAYVQSHGRSMLREQLGRLVEPGDSPLEGVLRRYGLADVADAASLQRRDQASKLLNGLERYLA